MKKKKIILIADDFTGSNDTGVQFSKAGLKTVVVTNLDSMSKALDESDVLVVDTETRFDNMETAYKKTCHVGKFIRDKNVDYVYKKLDSTFRGNIGSEIEGILDGTGISLAIVAPAFPSAGRKTLKGNVYVNDCLLEKTEFSKDPRNPVNMSFIPRIIAQQSNKKILTIDMELILKGKEKIYKEIINLKEKGADIILLDSENNENLREIAEAIALLKEKTLMVGSAGLAEFLPDTLKLKGSSESIGVVAGSVSNITRKQIDYALDSCKLDEFIINIEKIFSDKEEEKNKIVRGVIKSYKEDRNFVIRSTKVAHDVQDSIETGRKYGFDSFEVSDKIANFIGEITCEILNQIEIKGILLTGGDIAIKTANLLKVSGIEIKKEILPGIPYGYFIHDKYDNILVSTKAGGFGKEDAIVRIINYIEKGF